MLENPFTPTFGEVPTCLAGRNQIIRELERAFDSANRRPELTTIFSGARGTGKTTLLSVLASTAQKHGWIAASTTALPGMLEDIEIQAREQAAHLVAAQSDISVTGLAIPQLVELEFEHKTTMSNWRSRMGVLLDELAATGTGLVITVDEIDAKLDEMIQLAAVYQHFVREGKRVALLMAGLPSAVSTLLNDKTASFLRRANSAKLERIPDFEVRRAVEDTVRAGGRTASQEGLDLAVQPIDGFAFLLQLVGYYAWDLHPEEPIVSAEDFAYGAHSARAALEDRVFEATYRELSDEDLRFLEAMLQDEGDSRTADLVARLGRSSAQVAQYRARLIKAGVIGERRRGVVGFELLFFREFLIERKGMKP